MSALHGWRQALDGHRQNSSFKAQWLRARKSYTVLVKVLLKLSTIRDTFAAPSATYRNLSLKHVNTTKQTVNERSYLVSPSAVLTIFPLAVYSTSPLPLPEDGAVWQTFQQRSIPKFPLPRICDHSTGLLRPCFRALCQLRCSRSVFPFPIPRHSTLAFLINFFTVRWRGLSSHVLRTV